jgi:hypothetical protein
MIVRGKKSLPRNLNATVPDINLIAIAHFHVTAPCFDSAYVVTTLYYQAAGRNIKVNFLLRTIDPYPHRVALIIHVFVTNCNCAKCRCRRYR